LRGLTSSQRTLRTRVAPPFGPSPNPHCLNKCPFGPFPPPTGWAEPLPKAEAKLLVDKKELFIKLRLMKRGLGARCPTAGEARVFRGLCPHQALLSGFMGAKLPKGQSPGCVEVGKLPHWKRSSPFPLNPLAKPAPKGQKYFYYINYIY
jgi:hypothetical protein